VVPTAGLGARRFGTDKGKTEEQGLTMGQSGGDYRCRKFRSLKSAVIGMEGISNGGLNFR